MLKAKAVERREVREDRPQADRDAHGSNRGELAMLGELGIRLLVAWQRLQSERAQTLAEYGLITSVIAVAIVVAGVVFFRSAIIGAFGGATNCISAASTATSAAC